MRTLSGAGKPPLSHGHLPLGVACTLHPNSEGKDRTGKGREGQEWVRLADHQGSTPLESFLESCFFTKAFLKKHPTYSGFHLTAVR